jgi:hypothetical protein
MTCFITIASKKEIFGDRGFFKAIIAPVGGGCTITLLKNEK